jgi:hypothetical protein
MHRDELPRIYMGLPRSTDPCSPHISQYHELATSRG